MLNTCRGSRLVAAEEATGHQSHFRLDLPRPYRSLAVAGSLVAVGRRVTEGNRHRGRIEAGVSAATSKRSARAGGLICESSGEVMRVGGCAQGLWMNCANSADGGAMPGTCPETLAAAAPVTSPDAVDSMGCERIRRGLSRAGAR